MKMTTTRYIDMTDDADDCLFASGGLIGKPFVIIQGILCPVTIELRPKQAFQLLVSLKSVMKDIPLD